MAFDAETLQKQIPYYLIADPAQKELLKELQSLSDGATNGYYISKTSDPYIEGMLQGDGWRGFGLFSFESGSRKTVRGIVLSNSCDVSPENQRALPSKVTFAPMVRLSALKRRFENSNLNPIQIESKLQAIKSQSVTNIFYLPAGGELEEDYVALLDDLHSMPMSALQKSAGKLFTLSMAGFYLFVFKLSVHFCRFHENVGRMPQGSIA